MTMRRLEEYLEQQNVPFRTIPHATAYTAQETAALAHIPGHEVAKTVMVKIDGELAMAVVPANRAVDLDRLREVTGAEQVELAGEREFKDRFPDCEPGAMPPFGNLFGMDVIASEDLAEDEEIAFNAGNHRELMQMSYRDFERLVNPHVAWITRH
ncbi:MAG TPA: YbaK/EbsC family protein [Xanthomonadaceae bacterium]|nr:YbaK/EbsC family protein [Xanthomonadaceae bacterium]